MQFSVSILLIVPPTKTSTTSPHPRLISGTKTVQKRLPIQSDVTKMELEKFGLKSNVKKSGGQGPPATMPPPLFVKFQNVEVTCASLKT